MNAYRIGERRQQDDALDIVIPDHLPEIFDRVGQRVLRDHEIAEPTKAYRSKLNRLNDVSGASESGCAYLAATWR